MERLIPTETIIALETVPLRYGLGATEELGFELRRMGIKKALLVTDSNLFEFGLPDKVKEIAVDADVKIEIFDRVQIEPTDKSFEEAIEAAKSNDWDSLISVGGGSVIDTAKAMNLYSTHPAPLMDYINKPVGKGKPPPGPLRPHIAIPTTSGTGSETTPAAILDIVKMKVKTGISHRYLRPSLAIVDPLNTLTQPAEVTASVGCDVLTHAIESFTSKPYDSRIRPSSPAERPVYIGANPIADLWSEQAISWCAKYLRRAVFNSHDIEARSYMALASTFAGIGFGTAGVHVPHAMSYTVAGMVRDFKPAGYNVNEPLVPHGISVVVNAPACFRFTASAWPERHARAAELLGINTGNMSQMEAAYSLADAVTGLMRDLSIPNGTSALGYNERDIPKLVDGAIKQQRLLVNSPRPVGKSELEQLFSEALRYW
ncbi:iron-containing alcohol dehydrogenase [Desulfobacterota bacterium AH_259_B03_O07]|nr:iron-containing alcohol dehydrogenase [Desulfobacterota bacterium AH_259_B03_O07]